MKRASCVEGILIQLALHLDLVGADIVHSLELPNPAKIRQRHPYFIPT
jgi:hypothetical protein